MSTKLSFKEALERLDATKESAPVSSPFPTLKFLLQAGKIEQRVDVIRLLAKRGGLSLRNARGVLERILVEPIVIVDLRPEAPHALAHDLAQLGIYAVFFHNADEVFEALYGRLHSPTALMKPYAWSWPEPEVRPR
jgi:hypothetical protein